MKTDDTPSREQLLVQLMLNVFKVNGALLERGDEMVALVGHGT